MSLSERFDKLLCDLDRFGGMMKKQEDKTAPQSSLKMIDQLISELASWPVRRSTGTLTENPGLFLSHQVSRTPIPKQEEKTDVVMSTLDNLEPTLKGMFQIANTFRAQRLLPLVPDAQPTCTSRSEIVKEMSKWNSCIDNFIVAAGSLEKVEPYIPFIYYSFRNHIELNETPQHCMLCLNKNRKIADSHYVSKSILSFTSNYFIQPRDNESYSADRVTLPLFCTGTSSECEQMFSEKGERQFAASFLPFLKKLRELKSLSSASVVECKYESWLFYTIISLSFRLMVADFGQHNNDIINMSSTVNPQLEPFWKFFNKCRNYLIKNNDANPLLYVSLYFSEDGLESSSVQEHPIIHQLDYGRIYEGIPSYCPSIVYGIAGSHFVITDNEQLLIDIEKKMLKRSFFTRINPRGGNISVNLSTNRLQLPDIVQKAIQQYSEHIFKEMHIRNPQVILQNMQKKGVTPSVYGSDESVVRVPVCKPGYVVQLPKNLAFIENNSFKLNSNYLWEVGSLKFTGSQYEQLAFDIMEPPCKIASWLINHKYENQWFIVLQMQNHEGTHVVGAYDFTHSDLTLDRLQMMGAEDIFGLDLKISPRKGTDHSLFQLRTYEDDEKGEKYVINMVIARLLCKYYTEDLNARKGSRACKKT